MRRLTIDQALFNAAFERDVDYDEQDSLNAFLDLQSGAVEWVYDEDRDAEMYGLDAENNRTQRECIEADPDRFLLIPGLSHDEHHDVLQQFLASDWTGDQDLRKAARAAYFGSIGGWKRAINDEDVIRSYYQFRDEKIIDLATEFLLENRIRVNWK